MKATWWIASLIAISWAIPAHAEKPLPVTLSTFASPIYQSGEIIGCQLVFQVVRSDPEYSGGRPVQISGSLNFWAFADKDLAVGLKLGVSEISKAYEKKPPSDAYLINGYKTNISDKIGKSYGERGFRVFAYKLGDSTSDVVFNNIIEDSKFTFAYSMVEGGLDAMVPVDLTIEKLDIENMEKSLIGDRTVKDWTECVGQTVDEETKRLEGQDAADK